MQTVKQKYKIACSSYSCFSVYGIIQSYGLSKVPRDVAGTYSYLFGLTSGGGYAVFTNFIIIASKYLSFDDLHNIWP